MKKVIYGNRFCSALAFFLLFLFGCVYESFAAKPVLYFSDIVSGPKTGNSDSSGGRVPNQDGAIVTVWGVNLGTTQGSSKVYCNGAEAASYYFWGNAVKPANLSTFHKMQMVSFQISRLAKDGTGSVYIVVNGQQSNSLPFSVRSGNIYFVATSGNDGSGDGSWSRPWKTIGQAASSLSPGDIAYIGNGVVQTTETEFSACVNLSGDGEKGAPRALIVYPGATVRVGNKSIERAFHAYNTSTDNYSVYWVVAKFTITTGTIGVMCQTGFRVVGNYVTAPNGNGMDGAIDVQGKDVYVLGNEVAKVGRSSCSKLYHGIYLKGMRKDDPPRAATETNREVGWNYIHDNKCNRGVNIYNEQQYSAFLERHLIHDNVIINQRGDGIMLGYMVVGNNWIYNNLIINAGLGPEWSDDPSYHTGIRINTGHEQKRNAKVYCYNNTLYGCGWSGAADPNSTGLILISPEAVNMGTRVDFKNNIIFSTGESYLAGESEPLPTAKYGNCWYGKGNAPSWDTGAVEANPQFVNDGAKNLQLNPSSPCIDVGTKVLSVLRDLLGVSRPAGSAYDFGAYEYVSGSATPRSLSEKW